MLAKRAVIGLVVVVLMLPALAAVPCAQAQGGPTPEAVGLRPDAPRYARHGPYWVGVIEHEGETPTQLTTVTLWHPVLNPEGLEETITYTYHQSEMGGLPIAGHALKEAAPDVSGAPYPLVIFVHGHNGLRYSGHWLYEHLASHGFVVMAIDQADSQATPWGSARIAARLQDMTWQIDYADTVTSAAGPLTGMIDTNHVAIAGHSADGGTVLQSGGSEGDSRVDAIIPLAPYDGDSAANSSFTLPVLLMSGSRDEFLSTERLHTMYDSLGSTTKAIVVFQYAHHNIFGYSCEAAPWAASEGVYASCSDSVWDMDRVHDLANHYITAFLLDVLKGDEDAHQKLSRPVPFDGVEVEVVGY